MSDHHKRPKRHRKGSKDHAKRSNKHKKSKKDHANHSKKHHKKRAPHQNALPAEEVQKLVNTLTTVSPIFDVSPGAYQRNVPGFLYKPKNYTGYLPLSYWTTNDYLKDPYVTGGTSLKVLDVYNPGDYTLTPSSDTTVSPGTTLQVERVIIANGIDVYDAATYQIALSLAEVKSSSNPKTSTFKDLIEAQNDLLTQGYDGNAHAPPSSLRKKGAKSIPGVPMYANRGSSPTFTYGVVKPETLKDAQAYYFRIVTQNWYSIDPFKYDPSLVSYISQTGNPPSTSYHDYDVGNITWMDWKPITGENVWAFLIGPIQNFFIHGVDAF